MEGLSLHYTVEDGDTDIVTYLLSRGVNVNEKLDELQLTPLHVAVRTGKAEILRLLLDAPEIDVDEKDHEGNTPLHHAVHYGDHETVKLLIKAKADVNIRNNLGFTAFYWTLSKLLIRGKKTKTSDKDVTSSPVIIDKNDITIMKLLIEAGSDVNFKRDDGKIPLHLAINIGNMEVLELLIDAGADVNEKRGDGKTPVHLATITGKLDILNLMLDTGANVNAKDEFDRTALQYALGYCNFDFIKRLIVAGADVNSKCLKLGRSALHLAVDKNDIDMIEYLLYHGADINVKDNGNQTPLHYAAVNNLEESHLEVIQILLENNADVNALDDANKTPIDYLQAFRENNAMVLDLVFDHVPKNQVEVHQGETFTNNVDYHDKNQVVVECKELDELKQKIKVMENELSHLQKDSTMKKMFLLVTIILFAYFNSLYLFISIITILFLI